MTAVDQNTERGIFGDERSGRDVVALCFPDSFHFIDPIPEPKAWKLGQLPYFPDLDSVQPSGPNAQTNIATVIDLMRYSDQIICAMEASGEGQLLFQDLVDYARNRTGLALPDSKLFRIWPNVKTRDFVRQSLKSPRPHEEFKNLSKAAHLRRYIDWTTQYNYSKLYTIKYRRHLAQVFQLGRVSLHLLKQVTERYLERKEFKPKPFYEVHQECLIQGIGVVFKWTKDTANLTPYESAEGSALESEATTVEKSRTFLKKGARHRATESKDEAHTIANTIEPSSIIVASRTEIVRQPPPLLYTLTSLQREAYERYSISPHSTTTALQYLYEKYGFISNPSTTSHQLPISMLEEVEQVHSHFAGLKKYAPLMKDRVTRDRFINRDVRLFSDSISDSDVHAIVPLAQPATAKRREGITPTMEIILDMIIRRFLAAFMPDLTHSSITVTVENADKYYFEAKAAVLKSEGWKVIGVLPRAKAPFTPGPANFPSGYIASSVSDEEATQEELSEQKQLYKILGSLRLGDEIRGIIPASVITKEPSPPPLYTFSRVLALMEDKVTVISNQSSNSLSSFGSTAIPTSQDGDGEEGIISTNGDKNANIRLKFDAGLGTPDQRADILTNLVTLQWFRPRLDRYLEPTRKAILLTKQIQDDAIMDLSDSHSWENSLALIAKGRGRRGQALINRFRAIIEPDLVKYIEPKLEPDLLPYEVAYDLAYYHTQDARTKVMNELPALATTKCPKCGSKGHLKQGPHAFFCAAPTCNFTMPQNVLGRQLLVEEAKTLIQRKAPLLLTDLTDSVGNTFNATLSLALPLFQIKIADKVITKIAEPKPKPAPAPRIRVERKAEESPRVVSELTGPGRPSRGTSVHKSDKPKRKPGRKFNEALMVERLRARAARSLSRAVKRQALEAKVLAKRATLVIAPPVRVDEDGKVVRRRGRPRIGEVVPLRIKSRTRGRPPISPEIRELRDQLKRPPLGRPTAKEREEYALLKERVTAAIEAIKKAEYEQDIQKRIAVAAAGINRRIPKRLKVFKDKIMGSQNLPTVDDLSKPSL